MGSKIYTKGELAAMIPVPAIVERAVDEIDVQIGDAWHALRLAEQREEKTVGAAAKAQEVARKATEESARRRLELGRLLAEKRKAWPARGPKAKGWGEFLEKIGIEERTARNYMQLAGYVEEISETEKSVSETPIPTYAQAGIDLRARAEERPSLPTTSPTASTSVVTAPVLVATEQRTERSGGRGKPQWLMRAIVQHYTTAGDLVCDPLAGWGSTLRAALDEGRRALGSEVVAEIAKQAGDLPIRVGDWRATLAKETVDAIITDPPYSARTHAASRKFGNEREDGSPLDGLGPEYAAWTPDDVHAFVSSWSPRCRGWMVALTDHHLIPHWQSAYEEAGRYSFAPVVCLIRGMTVRLCGDGPSSWAIYAMVARPKTDTFSRWRTLPGGYVGSRDRLEMEGDA